MIDNEEELDETPVTGTAPQWAWDAILDLVRAAIVGDGVLDSYNAELLKLAETAIDFEGGKA